MIDQSIEVYVSLYKGKDYDKYMSHITKQDDEDLEQWQIDMKAAQYQDEPTFPKDTKVRMSIRPSEIVNFLETYSLSQSTNEEDAVLDATDVEFKSGLTILVAESYDTFKAKLQKFYEANTIANTQ